MKRSQVLLAMVGIIAVIAGAFIVVSRVVMASPIHLFDTRHHDSVEYMGMNICLTCHYGVHQNASESFHPQAIQSPVVAPQVVLADFNTAQDVRSINIGSESRAFTSEDTAPSANGFRQHYMMKTEDGFTLLPGAWVRMTQSPVEADSLDSTETCDECHTEGGNHIQLEKQNLPDTNQAEVASIRQKMVGVIITNVDGKLSTIPFISRDFPDVAMFRLYEKCLTLSIRLYLVKQFPLLLKPLLLDFPAAYPAHRRNGLT